MPAFHRYTCPLPGCGYPLGECPGTCLVPRPVPAGHGLPIDLVEPDEPATVGDRVPCHVFMPEVSWPVPVGPVIRMRPRRDHWLVEPPVRPEPSTDLLEPAGFGLVAALSLGTWCLGATLLVVAGLKGWL